MKKLIILSLIIPSFYIYSQEEFFGNQNGISLAGIKGINLDDDMLNGIGLSVHFKKGLTAGLSFQNNGYDAYQVASVGQFLTSDSSKNKLIIYYGISYANIYEINWGALNLGIINIFFRESKFPFSLKGHFLIQTGYKKSQKNSFDMVPIIECGYVQSLFVNNRLYPFIGISYTVEPIDKYSIYSIICGLNIKLGTSSKKVNKDY